jgi:uncharacterized damage-inducible protein DinB
MKSLAWFERKMTFGLPIEMLPFYLERLEGTAVRVEQKVKGLDEKSLSEKFNDKWSIKQHIGHLTEVDRINNKRIDEMTSGATMMSPAVFEPQDYNPWPIEKVVEHFQKTRIENITKYKSLTESSLVKTSIHPRLKIPMTPVDLAWFDAEHDDHHLVKISDIIKDHVHR